MSADSTDIRRALAAIGAPAMPYRRFDQTLAAEADIPAPAIAEACPFPLLAGALPEFAGALPPAPTGAAADEVPSPVAPAPLPPPATPTSPPSPAAREPVTPSAQALAAPPAPWRACLAASAPARTPLARVFQALRGEAPAAAPGSPPARGLHDLFRRL